MKENMCCCRFCGQAYYDAECDEAATLKCECPQAKEYQREREAVTNATRQICEVLHDNAEKNGFAPVDDNMILTMATTAAELIVTGKLRSMAFVIDSDSSVKISETSKNTVKIERKRAIVMTSEA
jgi:hypothetical protein